MKNIISDKLFASPYSQKVSEYGLPFWCSRKLPSIFKIWHELCNLYNARQLKLKIIVEGGIKESD